MLAIREINIATTFCVSAIFVKKTRGGLVKKTRGGLVVIGVVINFTSLYLYLLYAVSSSTRNQYLSVKIFSHSGVVLKFIITRFMWAFYPVTCGRKA